MIVQVGKEGDVVLPSVAGTELALPQINLKTPATPPQDSTGTSSLLYLFSSTASLTLPLKQVLH